MQDVAVVVLNWNGLPWLQRFLPLMVQCSPGAQVVVADNGSTDASVQWVQNEMPSVLTLLLDKNYGFAGGYNQALARISASYYVLVNSDVEVVPGWLDALRGYLEEHPTMAACQPKVLSFAEAGRFEHAGAAGGYVDRNGYPFCRGRIFELTEHDQGQYDDDRDVFWATGACLCIRANAFHEVGGFDAALFAHMEEVDLCWRLRRRGWRIGYTARTQVKHVGGGTLPYGHPRKTYLNFRNSLVVLTKNLHTGSFAYWLLRRMVLDIFAAGKFFFDGHPKDSWQVFRAHRHFVGTLPRVWQQRRKLKRDERDPDLTGLYLRSVAYDRYILKHRRFSELDPAAFTGKVGK
jgi:GT2 family glycosyltransferase